MPDASTPDRLDALAVRSDHEGDHELALLLSDAAALASLGPEALRAAHARLAPLLPTPRPAPTDAPPRTPEAPR